MPNSIETFLKYMLWKGIENRDTDSKMEVFRWKNKEVKYTGTGNVLFKIRKHQKAG